MPTAQVRLHEPGLFTRLLRLSIQPEAAFFFLVIGLTLAAFEFYAIGPGLAAATGVVSLDAVCEAIREEVPSHHQANVDAARAAFERVVLAEEVRP